MKNLLKFFFKGRRVTGQSNGTDTGVKRTGYSYRESEFNSQHPLSRGHSCMWHAGIHSGKIAIQIK